MKIIVATDDSEFARSAIAFAGRMSYEADSEIELVTVIEPVFGVELETIIDSTDELTDPESPSYPAACERLENSKRVLSDVFSGQNLKISTKVLAGPAARAVVEEAEAWKADLIVVGTHGLGFWKRALIGSVADRIVRHAPCAVLTVR